MCEMRATRKAADPLPSCAIATEERLDSATRKRSKRRTDAATRFFPFPFPNPATPDLGCFVRRKHGLETGPFNVHVEFQPSIDIPQLRQQLYFRIVKD